MRLWPSWLVVTLIVLAGCQHAPESYPPPIQRRPLAADSGPAAVAIVTMSDLDAPTHFVRDISPGLEGGRWRWTYQRPELTIYLASVNGLKLIWEFSIVPVTFKETGPVTVSFFVNGKYLGKAVCPKPGEYRYEQPVPAGFLIPNASNRIAAQADKIWTSPTDGAKLGFTMTRAGFMP